MSLNCWGFKENFLHLIQRADETKTAKIEKSNFLVDEIEKSFNDLWYDILQKGKNMQAFKYFKNDLKLV